MRKGCSWWKNRILPLSFPASVPFFLYKSTIMHPYTFLYISNIFLQNHVAAVLPLPVQLTKQHDPSRHSLSLSGAWLFQAMRRGDLFSIHPFTLDRGTRTWYIMVSPPSSRRRTTCRQQTVFHLSSPVPYQKSPTPKGVGLFWQGH